MLSIRKQYNFAYRIARLIWLKDQIESQLAYEEPHDEWEPERRIESFYSRYYAAYSSDNLDDVWMEIDKAYPYCSDDMIAIAQHCYVNLRLYKRTQSNWHRKKAKYLRAVKRLAQNS